METDEPMDEEASEMNQMVADVIEKQENLQVRRRFVVVGLSTEEGVYRQRKG
ncbi:hypothetical protein HanRHA438_Chr15g0722551 [Helianthus annuus]|nr:hypothetical protein HanRHA438_Chr15g0722551 [Helianthus annuus]